MNNNLKSIQLNMSWFGDFTTRYGKNKWKRLDNVYYLMEKRLSVQRQIDKLNIQYDELSMEIYKERNDIVKRPIQTEETVNVIKENENYENVNTHNNNVQEPELPKTNLMQNSLLYTNTIGVSRH